ncbi:hypothetical protein DIPPA_04509 [Diplonema papillatum]|nr:hypothetical protein DIPPA_04509 [Diplonema papillatum]
MEHVEVERVENWLLSTGEGYKEHVQKLRAEQVKETLTHLRDAPEITTYARELKRGGVPVEVRLMQHKQKKMRWAAQKQAEKETEEAKHAFSPKINEASKAVSPRYDSQAWHERSRARLESLREAQRKGEVEELQGTPCVNLQSDVSRTSSVPLQERLMQARSAKEQLYFEMHEASAMEGLRDRPAISARASRVRSESPVHERLHASARRRRDSRTSHSDALGSPPAAAARAPPAAAHAACRTPRGRVASPSPARFSSPTPEGSEALRRSRSPTTPVHDRLLAQHEERSRRQEDAQQEDAARIKRLASQSHTTPRSRAMLDAYEQRYPTDGDRARRADVLKRRQHEERKQAFLNSGRAFDQEQQDFDRKQHPALTEQQWHDMHRRLMATEGRKERRLEQLRSQADALEMKECTFDPSAAPALHRAGRSDPLQTARRVKKMPLPQRAMLWLSRKEEKLAAMKAENDRKEREALETHSPYTNAEVPVPRACAQRMTGYDEYIERMRKAREMKEEKELRQTSAFRTNCAWTGKATTPIEPALGPAAAHARSYTSQRSRSIPSSFEAVVKNAWNPGSTGKPAEAAQQPSFPPFFDGGPAAPGGRRPAAASASSASDASSYQKALEDYYSSAAYREWWFTSQAYYQHLAASSSAGGASSAQTQTPLGHPPANPTEPVEDGGETDPDGSAVTEAEAGQHPMGQDVGRRAAGHTAAVPGLPFHGGKANGVAVRRAGVGVEDAAVRQQRPPMASASRSSSPAAHPPPVSRSTSCDFYAETYHKYARRHQHFEDSYQAAITQAARRAGDPKPPARTPSPPADRHAEIKEELGMPTPAFLASLQRAKVHLSSNERRRPRASG